MSLVIYATPYLTDSAIEFIGALSALPEISLAVISQDTYKAIPAEFAPRVLVHWIIQDVRERDQIVEAARAISAQSGPIFRMLATNEQIQIPISEAREVLGVPGLSSASMRNFRDKARMKDCLEGAKVPCARHALITDPEDAWQFATSVGFPIVIKPPSGAAAQATYRADGPDTLHEGLLQLPPSDDQPVLLEEFLTGSEHSFDVLTLKGKPVWHSLSCYYPTPLEVMHNPWIQWRVVLPRDIDTPYYDDIRETAFRALAALGIQTGMSHTEWFRRPNGTVAISEVGARPPGAQFTKLIARAYDVDFLNVWARLILFSEFKPMPRQFSSGAAYLRGQGQGLIRAIHGLAAVRADLGDLITDVRVPSIGHAPKEGYEGDGYIIVRHPETEQVEQALLHIVTNVRIELG